MPRPWTVRAAHLAALSTLPSCVWRLMLAAGFAMGYDPAWPMASAVPASIGAVALVALWSPNLLMFTDLYYDPLEPQSGWQLLMATAYLPLILWGPLLAAVTWAYCRRRCTGDVKV